MLSMVYKIDNLNIILEAKSLNKNIIKNTAGIISRKKPILIGFIGNKINIHKRLSFFHIFK